MKRWIVASAVGVVGCSGAYKADGTTPNDLVTGWSSPESAYAAPEARSRGALPPPPPAPPPPIESALIVNGARFAAVKCTSGNPQFTGIDMVDANGAKLRLVAELDGRTTAIVFAKNAKVGTWLSDCGDLSFDYGTALRGNTKLECGDAATTVSGWARFRCDA
jgi:hypothetical protein